MPDEFSKQLNENWSSRHSDDKCFVNEHFLTIIRGQAQGGVIGAINLVNQAQQKLINRLGKNTSKKPMAN